MVPNLLEHSEHENGGGTRTEPCHLAFDGWRGESHLKVGRDGTRA